MEFIKNNLKVFVAVIITLVISVSGTVYAITQFSADQVSFTPSQTNIQHGFAATNVENALDKLYEKINVSLNKSGINQNSGSTIQVEKGSYIAISSVDKVSQITNCETIIDNSQGGEAWGVASWSSVYKAIDTNVTITINNNSQFTYYVFK